MILAADKAVVVRAGLAGNVNLCPEALEVLLTDPKGTYLKKALVTSRRAPSEMVRECASSSASRTLRATVAQHTDDPDLLARLSMSREASVRRRVTSNAACPEEAHVAAALFQAR